MCACGAKGWEGAASETERLVLLYITNANAILISSFEYMLHHVLSALGVWFEDYWKLLLLATLCLKISIKYVQINSNIHP